jgi:transposase
MPAGRPTKYKPEFCEIVIACGDEGKGKAEMARELEIHHSTFSAWQEEHPEFSAAVKEALFRSQAWWEGKGRQATFGEVQGFNATSYIFNMKNRFPDEWRDKHEVENKHDVSDPLADLLAAVASSGKRVTDAD